MTTQFKHTAFRDFPILAQPPQNIRVAYIAGPTTIAANDAVLKLPAGEADKTLEEIAITSLANELIAEAGKLFSPRMYAAFLAWGAGAARYSGDHADDDEGMQLGKVHSANMRRIAAISAANPHDLAFKAYLSAIETSDSSCMGPVLNDDPEYPADLLLLGVNDDLVAMAPLVTKIDGLARQAWAFAPTQLVYVHDHALAIAAAFDQAIEAAPDLLDRVQAIPPSYHRFMRGPWLAWNRAYDDLQAAKQEVEDCLRERVRPAYAASDAVKARYPADYNFMQDPIALAAVEPPSYHETQAAVDRLFVVEADARVALYCVPAPSPAELAIKLRLFEEELDFERTDAPEVIRQLVIDARRFGHLGAHIESDKDLLSAFAKVRTFFNSSPHADSDDEAAFEALDAAEAVLLKNRATTIEGVIAKLRTSFVHMNPDAWSDKAVVDPNNADFKEGLGMSDMFERMFWSGIEDLARIGGINLAEHGA